MASLIALGYVGLFMAALLAGSIVPFASEVVFTGVVMAGLDITWCIVVATIGNWIGGMTCYYMGYLGNLQWIEKHLKIKEEKIEKYKRFLQGKGAWMTFFAWVPIVGAIITVTIGLMRGNIKIAAFAMLLGKLTRYIIWILTTNELLSHFNF